MNENNETNSDQLHLKQELLKSEIIAKNYEPQKFLEYCINLKENGDDMNNWTYEELKLVLENFKGDYEAKKEQKILQQKKQAEKEKEKEIKDEINTNENIKTEKLDQIDTKKEEHNNNTNNINNKIPIVEKKEEQKEAIKITEKNDNFISMESKIRELPCKLLEKSKLNDKEIKVTIKDPITSEKTLLSLPYVTYEVFTEPSNWSVRRRYSDFFLLRNILCKYFPRYLIPPLPEKKLGNKRFQSEFIEKRMKILQLFIDEVTCNETLKSNEALVAFLFISDHKAFEARMKELMNKNLNNNNFEEIKTMNGKVNILEQDNYSDLFLTKINNFFKNQKQIFNKLNNALKSYYRNSQIICQNLEDITKNLEDLEKINLEMNINEQILKSYEMMKIFFMGKKRITEKESEIIYDKIKSFFKLEKLRGNSFIEIIDSRETIKQKYTSENNKLIAKKEKLYTSVKDINKWEINNLAKIDKPLLLRDKNYAFKYMCFKDNQNIEAIKNLLEFCNYNNYIFFKKYNKENAKNYIDNMKIFTELIYPYINDTFDVGNKLKNFI